MSTPSERDRTSFDDLLPEQLSAGWSDVEPRLPTAERRLVAAMLDDALRCVRRPRRDGVSESEASAAEAWLASDDRTWPFAFENVCDALGLDAEAVRATLDRRGATAGSSSIRRRGSAPRSLRHAA